jgi:hypothetical protein
MPLTLSIAVFLGTLGAAVWLLGTLFNYQAVAVIGATVVVGLGAGLTSGGLYHATGEVQAENITDVGSAEEDLVANPGEWQLLNGSNLVRYSETVEQYNSTSGSWETLSSSAYEFDYKTGAINLSSSNVDDGTDIRVSYRWQESETVTETQYSEWEPSGPLPLGYLVMLLGAVFALRPLDMLGGDQR